ncbi:MAG: sigma 54-interacting transcriptional regulator [Desulfobacteraceae bacterium]|nr:sigma 54-interacting transcriptional regulator [Desulfobacteraceae bacterium]
MPAIKQQDPETGRDARQYDTYALSVASLFECPFSIDWLAELTGKKITALISDLENAAKEGILRVEKPGIYSFQQSQVRKELQTSLDEQKKERLNKKISELIVRDSLGDAEISPERIASHLLRIHNSLEGCRYLISVGDLCLQNYDQTQAFKCYSKVLTDLGEDSGEPVDDLFIETAIKFSKISTAKHDTDKVLCILDKAMERAKALGDQRRQSLLEMHIAKNEWLKAKYDSALFHFENGWALAKELNDPKVERAASTFSNFFLFWQGRFKEVIKSYEKSVSDIESFPQGGFPLLAAITVGYCYAQVGQITQGLGMLYSIRNHCIEKSNLYLAAYASGNIGEILLGLNKIDEALYYLNLSAKEAKKTDNNWVWITVQVFLAFCYYLAGKKQLCVKHLEAFFTESSEVKITVNPYPYLIYLAKAMEQGEIPFTGELSVRKMLGKYIRSKNIFMKGIGYRYKALTQREDSADTQKVIHSLEQSLKCLEESGQSIELSKTRLELARMKLCLGEKAEARSLAETAAEVLSAHNENMIPDDLINLIEIMPRKEMLLKEIMSLSQEMVSINDNKELIQYIISAVNRLTGAERGAIFLWNDEKTSLRLIGSKNMTAAEVNHPDFLSSAIYKLIEEVATSGKGCIKNNDDENLNTGYVFSCESVRSRICVPMVFRQNIIGVLYHDNRLLTNIFRESDLETLSYFAALAAFALDNVQAYKEIKRLNNTLRKEKQYYQEEHIRSLNFSGIVGKSNAISRVMEKIAQVAETDATVLIEGETGVGKELVARAIHDLSLRKKNPFIGVQCSALPEELIPSELFGHEKGAFTGAQKKRTGRFELADSGTLFLDEIGNIRYETQIRLLRVLQTKEFERVGGTETLQSDFRLIVATNKNLEEMVHAGKFRADLYYRLNIFPIHVPPLRERKEDIPLLVEHFRQLYANKMGKNIRGISKSDMSKLKQYSFPGNVRELQNIIERACILSTGEKLCLPEAELKTDHCVDSENRQSMTLKENERRHILWALQQTGGKIRGKGGAAELLEIHPSTLAFRMKKLGIQRQQT